VGTDPILRTSQLQVNPVQYETLISTPFGCPNPPSPANGYSCAGGATLPPRTFSQYLSPVPGTNWVPRMSTGLELQTMLPVVNAPFRIYYAYNALRLNGSAQPPVPITTSMFPAGAAGYYTYRTTLSTLGSTYSLL